MHISHPSPIAAPLTTWPVLARRNPAALAADLLPLCDFASLMGMTSLASWLLGQWLVSVGAGPDLAQAALAGSVLAPFMLYDKGFGTAARRGRMRAVLRAHVMRFALFALVLLAVAASSEKLEAIPPSHFALWLSAALLVTGLTRVFMGRQLNRLQRQGHLSESVAVVGAGPQAKQFAQALGRAGTGRIEMLGLFDDRLRGATPHEAGLTGTLAQLIELAATRRIDWIVLTIPNAPPLRLDAIALRLAGLAVPIGLCPDLAGPLGPPRAIDAIGGSVPVERLVDRPIGRWDAVLKGAEDLLLGSLITLALLPVLALIALAVRLDSPGPVIFRQRRHALDNRVFDIFKFRTMTWNPAAATTGLQQTGRGDSRITRVGRFLRASSLDELPQLFNVLQGTMSLVGPRPHATDMRTEQRLGEDITDLYAHRHRVKPGITGWAQVNGARGATDTTAQLARRVELDLDYIEHWSLWLDLKILLLTAPAVLKRTNAF